MGLFIAAHHARQNAIAMENRPSSSSAGYFDPALGGRRSAPHHDKRAARLRFYRYDTGFFLRQSAW
jgi:hypothetical protein